MSEQPHYVRDYRDMAAFLIGNRPTLDEAMSEAVGGHYDLVGQAELDLLTSLGLKGGSSIIDIGCGSGRLATAAARRFGTNISFTGTDVVQEFLDYARSKCPPNFHFVLHTDLSVPAAAGTADFVTAFSVLTHLLPHESYIYLEDMRRALSPGGKIVFSFLECALHWPIFERRVAEHRANIRSVMVTFLEQPMIDAWAAHLGLKIECYLRGTPLGQSAVVLSR